MKLWRFSGVFLAITGLIHSVLAVLLGWDMLVEILQDGLVNSLRNDPAQRFSFWFLICGLILILFGLTLDYFIKQSQKPAPLLLGYSFLFLSLVGCLIDPLSGFWLFIPQAIIIIIGNKR